MEAQENVEAQENPGLDTLLAAYKASVEAWIAAIREEEQLAASDHSMRDWEVWDQAVLKEQDAGEAVAEAREEYEDALRKALLNF
jgi:hypothetical protein